MTKITKTALERKRAAAIEAEDRAALAKQVRDQSSESADLQKQVRDLNGILWLAAKACGGGFTIPRGVIEDGVPGGSSVVTGYDEHGNMVIEAKVGAGGGGAGSGEPVH